MPRSWILRVQDIITAIEAARADIADLSFEEFARRDNPALRAVAFSLVVVGEAAAAMPDDVRARAPGIPWDVMRGMRNRIVHEYFGLNAEIVWDTVLEDLPELVDQLRTLLESVSPEP